MSAVLPVAETTAAPAATGVALLPRAGFFAHHGIWAPGVRLFRRIGFTAKAAIISLAFMLPMLGLLGWLLESQTDQAEATRREALRQPVLLAHGLVDSAYAQQRSGSLTKEQAQQLARRMLAALQVDGRDAVWVQAQQDVPLAQAHAGDGFVTQAGAGGSGERLSYVQGFEPWQWAIGASAPIDDLQSGLMRRLAWAGGVVALAQLVAGYLFLSFYRVMDGGLRETRRHLRAMTAGDLTTSPRGWGQDESAQLMQELGRMQASLRSMVRSVRSVSDGIVHASEQMAGGAADLSQRTDHAAAALEQSSAAMAQIAAQVGQGVTHTEEASRMARHNADIAADGGRVMREVVQTMEGIRVASARIGEIVGTIDGIAFQTNILALNAAVEAARAGEQGRGFAVVAGEVRSLAQRSAQAAKEIKQLITDSNEKVETGSRLVDEAGTTMNDIVTQVRRMNDLIAEVNASTTEQSVGIGQVNQAVASLDHGTQQNAALVEESAAAAESLRQQAAALQSVISAFKLRDTGMALHHHASQAELLYAARPVGRQPEARPLPSFGAAQALKSPSLERPASSKAARLIPADIDR